MVYFQIDYLAAALAGWNEGQRNRKPSPRYWNNEVIFKPDSLIKEIGDTVYVFKLRKQ